MSLTIKDSDPDGLAVSAIGKGSNHNIFSGVSKLPSGAFSARASTESYLVCT
jgi:hypothetical protein